MVFMLAMAYFVPLSWVLALFVLDAICQGVLAYNMDHAAGTRVAYYDPTSPRSRKVALIVTGLAHVVRWRLAGSLVFLLTRHVYFLIAEVLFSVMYFAFAFLNTSPRLRFLNMFSATAILVLLTACYYRYEQRSRVYSHLRDDPRLFLVILSLAGQLLAVYPLPRYIPAWIIEITRVLTYMLMFAGTGHEALHRV